MYRTRRLLAAAAASALSISGARGADVSPPVIMQWFESSWKTMQNRTPDVFMAGYGAVWTPPPGRALYDDQGGGIGYNLYDRFDMGKPGDPTLYGTERQYRAMINGVHQMNGAVYVDFVHHHVGSWDVPGYNGWGSYTPPSSSHVQDRSDYPGFELSDPYVGASSFDPNYRNLAGQRDSYSDAPPVNDGNTTQFQYQYRLANLITIDLTSGRSFVRNPVPGNPNNIRQAPNGWAIATSTLLANGKAGASTIVRQANTPSDDNRRFYPDQSLPGITVTDPATGGGTYTIHPFNTANPSAGDPTAETNAGYMMRYAQWLVNDIGVDGLRIDAARHVPYGQTGDPYNPDNINVPALIDRAVFDQSRRTNLDGTQRKVFSFQEVFTGDKVFNQQFVRKDINPATPSVVGGNRDVLDFPGWFAMRSNLTSNGLHNNWYNIRYSSQDSQDDGIANNGSQSIRFVINHDDGKGNSSDQANDYVYLDNVAHAWTLMQPGNAYVYFNAHEFDRTGNTSFFLKDGRGDALGGQYGTIITKLLDIRNSYGRGNFSERWIDSGGFSNVYAFERDRSMIVGLNSALGTTTDFDQRTMSTGFAPGSHLVELTGNANDGQVDPSNQISNTLVVDGSGNVTMRIPRNENVNGVIHGRGYVIYGLQRPQGAVALSNVSQTLAGETPTPATNGTARLTSIDVITGNTFNVTLSTNAVTLADNFRDHDADGDRAYVRVDGGVDLNNSGGVDYTTQSDTRYGFENFSTTNSPGYFNGSGNGTYVQSVNSANLSEGYHYITTRAYRHRADGGPDIYNDFKKVIYVDRLPPSSAIESLTQSGSGNAKALNVAARSLDQTADNVHVLLDTGAALTDAQVLALLGGSSKSAQTDVDLFSKDFSSVTTGIHVITIVTREITGHYSIIRATGYQVPNGRGLGFGDLNSDSIVNSTDISQFQTVLQSNNSQFNAAAEGNTDGVVNLADTFLLGPRLTAVGADGATVTAYNNVINSATVTSGTYTVNANHTVYDVTAGTTHVLSGAALSARSIRNSNLVIDDNAAVTIQPRSNGGATIRLNSLSLVGSGKLDTNDQDLVVAYSGASAFDQIRDLVFQGYSSIPDGSKTGIISTAGQNAGNTILALFDNALVGASDWPLGTGVTISSNSVVGKYTYFGDMNLDGQVTPDDYGILDANFGTTPPEGIAWLSGDANLDGTVTADDYGILDGNFGSGVGSPLAPSSITAVPEPCAVAVLGFGALLVRRRKWRSRPRLCLS